MGKVIAVKIPDELKERMDRHKDRVKWPEVLRRFIYERVRIEEGEESIEEVVRLIESTKSVPENFSVSSVREDRDSS